jgi:hypothetical protein
MGRSFLFNLGGFSGQSDRIRIHSPMKEHISMAVPESGNNFASRWRWQSRWQLPQSINNFTKTLLFKQVLLMHQMGMIHTQT